MIRYNEPVKRFGTPEEIVYLKVFLFSQKASFVTGSVLAVGWGQTVGIWKIQITN